MLNATIDECRDRITNWKLGAKVWCYWWTVNLAWISLLGLSLEK